MGTQLDQKQSRREFLRGSVRYLTLGGLVSMAGGLFVRRNSGKCVNLEICNGCPVFKKCDLPLAIERRSEESAPTKKEGHRGD